MNTRRLPKQNPLFYFGSNRSALFSFLFIGSVSALLLTITSCSQKLNSLQCNHEICDTIDSHRIIFNLESSDTLNVNLDDTIKINDKVNTIRLEGWHCQSCKGIEVVRVQNCNGQLIDSLFVSHHGNCFESNYWKLDKIQNDITYRVIWMTGVDFYLSRR